MPRNSYRRQSLIVNNFFTLASIIIIAATLTLYNRYFNQDIETTSEDKKPKTYLRLECQKDNDRFKVISHKLMNSSLKAIENGHYKISGGFVKKEKDSILEQIVTKEKIDNFYKNSLNIPQKENISKYLEIDYEIIESNKKSSTVFKSGSVKTLFKVNGNEIFSYYSDFKFYDENEIKDIINCTISVYKSYASK